MAEQYNSAHTGLEIDEAVIAALNLNAKNGVGEGSIQEGLNTDASGDGSHAEGYESQAQGDYSHAEGSSLAGGKSSHAEGGSTQAIGVASHAEGGTTYARGEASHAEGGNTKAGGNTSHAEGYGTVAVYLAEHVQGLFNIPSGDYDDPTEQDEPGMLHVVGNGTDDNNRSNAHTLDIGGNAWFAGDVYVHSTSGTNRDDGSEKLATEGFVKSYGGATVKQYTGTLLADSWAVDANGYLAQTVTITGLSATYKVDPQWDVVLSGTDHDADIALLENFSLICNFTTGAGTLTAQCLGVAPTVNIPIKVVTFT